MLFGSYMQECFNRPTLFSTIQQSLTLLINFKSEFTFMSPIENSNFIDYEAILILFEGGGTMPLMVLGFLP